MKTLAMANWMLLSVLVVFLALPEITPLYLKGLEGWSGHTPLTMGFMILLWFVVSACVMVILKTTRLADDDWHASLAMKVLLAATASIVGCFSLLFDLIPTVLGQLFYMCFGIALVAIILFWAHVRTNIDMGKAFAYFVGSGMLTAGVIETFTMEYFYIMLGCWVFTPLIMDEENYWIRLTKALGSTN